MLRTPAASDYVASIVSLLVLVVLFVLGKFFHVHTSTLVKMINEIKTSQQNTPLSPSEPIAVGH